MPIIALVLGILFIIYVVIPLVAAGLAVAAVVACVYAMGLAARDTYLSAVDVAARRRSAPTAFVHNEAHLAYLFGPAWMDLRQFFQDFFARAIHGIVQQRHLLHVATEPEWIAFRCLTLFFVSTFGLLGCVAVSALLWAVLVAIVAVLTVLLGLLYLTDLAWLAARGMFVQCPKCDQKMYHFHYDCPHCKGVPQRHQYLRVNRAGALYHRCAKCGGRVPAHVLTGRGRNERAYCANLSCQLPIERELVVAKMSRVALVGGADSGKTTLLVAAARWFESSPTMTHVRVQMEEPAQRAQMASWIGLLKRGQAPPKTQVVRHRAFTFMLEAAGQRMRSLYFFDTSGEMFRNQSLKDKHGYFAGTEVIVFVLDPFSLPRYVEQLRNSPSWQTVKESLPSATPPWEVVGSLINILDASGAQRREGKFRVPILVVLTKTDVLDLHRQLQGLDAAKRWLQKYGADVSSVLGSNFASIEYFSIQACPVGGGARTADGVDNLMGKVIALALPDFKLDGEDSPRGTTSRPAGGAAKGSSHA